MATIALAFALLLSLSPSIEASRSIHERSLTQAPATPVTIASTAAGVPALSTLLAAVSASPPILAAATNPNSTLTVFAPTNEASEMWLRKLPLPLLAGSTPAAWSHCSRQPHQTLLAYVLVS